MKSRATFRSFLVAALLGLLVVATGWSAGLLPQAQAQGGDFEISVDSAVVLDGASGDVTLRVTPGAAAPAAMNGSVAYNDAELTVTACTMIIAVGDCNIDTDGLVKFSAIDPQGWSEISDLFVISVQNTGLASGESPLTLATTTVVDASSLELSGELVSGVISTVTHGDVNCDNAVTVVDALLIAQYTVSNRTGVDSCPLLDVTSEVLVPTIDVNCDGAASIVDALVIAQYSVGNRTATTTCPLADPTSQIYLGP